MHDLALAIETCAISSAHFLQDLLKVQNAAWELPAFSKLEHILFKATDPETNTVSIKCFTVKKDEEEPKSKPPVHLLRHRL